MTHNLPYKIRKHFAEQNKSHLEKQAGDTPTEIIPSCPIYRYIRDEGKIVYSLDAYGVKSNSCMDCPGIDISCELFRDWYEKRHLRG